MTMDDTDHQLIALLRQDARLPVASLAARLKVWWAVTGSKDRCRGPARHQRSLGLAGRVARRIDGRVVAGAGAYPVDQGHCQHRDEHPARVLPLKIALKVFDAEATRAALPFDRLIPALRALFAGHLPALVLFDLDRGCEIAMRALGCCMTRARVRRWR